MSAPTLSTRLAYRMHLAAASAAYREPIVNNPPHPKLFFTDIISREIAEKIRKGFDGEADVEIANVRSLADPRYKVPQNIMSEEEYWSTVPHKRLGVTRRYAEQAFSEIASKIEPVLGYRVRVLNTRFFCLRAGGAGGHYINRHTDGFPPGVYKVLLYLTGANSRSGTTRIYFDGPSNAPTQVDLEAGGFCLFDSNNLLHEAVPPTDLTGGRVTLEYTIAPSFTSDCNIPEPGFYAFYPYFPLEYFQIILNELKA